MWINGSNNGVVKLRVSDGGFINVYATQYQNASGMVFDGANVWVETFTNGPGNLITMQKM